MGFSATDRLANAAMWLIAHMSYARRVDLSGAPLKAEDFKPSPEGHMGGSLNMAIAFAGYLAANALSGHIRAWTLGQGHCVENNVGNIKKKIERKNNPVKYKNK